MNKNKPYDIVLVANYLLALANEKGVVLNTTKVQKLLYMAYGLLLAEKNRIITDEQPKAWPYGPVFPKTRKKANYSKIQKTSDNEFSEIKEDFELTDCLNKIIDKFSGYTATQLSNWSHDPQGPWQKTVDTDCFEWNTPILNNYIKDYFKEFII
ncbi:MAG: DUF4065 domain-containing protein [Apibacter sp.]|nr:DUF4065 domain-containing protein [Apibacter sp.]